MRYAYLKKKYMLSRMNIACNFVSCVILNVPLTDWYGLDGYLKSELSLIHLEKLQSKSFPVSIRVEKVLNILLGFFHLS